jgi:hypothetical protein
MVRSVGVFSNSGAVEMGAIGVTTLHPQGQGVQGSPFARGSITLIGEFLNSGVQGRWPAVHHPYKDGIWVLPLGRKAQATEAVGGELQSSKTNGLTRSESNTGRVVAVGNEGEFW